MNIFPAGTIAPGVAGLRPEHISITDAAPGCDMAAEVDFTESLGSETLVHVVFRGVPVVVRLPGFAAYRPGDRVCLRPDMGKAVQFPQP
jgi:ABC-type sugar transport system ATPase subunit